MSGHSPINAAMGGNESERNPAFRGLLGRVDLLITVVYRGAFSPPLFKVTKYFMNICRAKHSLPSPHQPSVTHSLLLLHIKFFMGVIVKPSEVLPGHSVSVPSTW